MLLGAALIVFAAAPEAVAPAIAPVAPGKYQIGPEDLLFIRVWREPDFTLPVAVRPDGKITMPLIGDVRAAGQTPLQLTAALKESLMQYLNKPDVNVFVTEVRSKKFYIDGEMYRPGSFALVTPTTVLEALSRGGGFRESRARPADWSLRPRLSSFPSPIDRWSRFPGQFLRESMPSG